MKKIIPILLLLCVTLTACATVSIEPKNTADGSGAGSVTASTEPSRTASETPSAAGTSAPTPAPEPFALYPAYVQLPLGQHVTLDASSAPTGQRISWSSSDTSVVTVDENGRLTPVAEGEAVVTATLANGETSSCGVRVAADGNIFLWEETPDLSDWDVNSSGEQ